MSSGDLLQAIGKLGDSRWSRRMSDSYQGAYVRVTDPGPPYWSLLYRVYRYANSRMESGSAQDVLLVAALFLPPVDAVHWALRAAVFPLFLALWWCEWGLARLLGRTFFCPLCYNPMTEPYVYCPKCGRVQGRLRPRIGSLLFKRCSGCGETRWRLMGNYLISPPQPLMCRDTPQHTGCYRPHQLGHLAGTCSAKRIALVGPGVGSKHVFLAHLANQMVNGHKAARGSYRPVGRLSELEFQLMTQVLARSAEQPTDHCERPGSRYTLARTFVLQRRRGGNLALIHNVSHDWIRYEERLFTDGLAWRGIRSLIFVVDSALMEADGRGGGLSHAEVYSRVVRVVEKDLSLAPGMYLPFRVAVVLPLASSAKMARFIDSRGAVPAADVERFVAQGAPALYALIQRTVAPRHLQYLGGLVTPNLDLDRSGWLRDVVRWTIRC